MLSIIMITALTLTAADNAQSAYVLEYPGLAFDVLPDIMTPPVEGTLDEDSGVITSSPSSDGAQYWLYYWKETIEPNTRKDEWLSRRFSDTISPDLLPTLLIGSVEWTHGSSAIQDDGASVGLVPVLNFNKVDDRGDVIASGHACAIFVGDYAILFYGMAPHGSGVNVKNVMDNVVANMHLL